MNNQAKKLDKKQLSERFVGETVNFCKALCEQFKTNFAEHGQEIVKNSGALGSLIKLFSQQAIDQYFAHLSEKKRHDLGIQCYLKAAIEAAEQALTSCEAEVPGGGFDFKAFIAELDTLKTQTSSLRLYLNPAHNPAVGVVKKTYQSYLCHLGAGLMQSNRFGSAFEKSIQTHIEDQFGSDYQSHLKDAQQQWFKQEEENLLFDMQALKQVGLQKGESLGFEQTFGQWRSVIELTNGAWLYAAPERQQPVEALLNQPPNPDVMTYLMRFVVADFGKGKTVFLRNYAASLAEQYLATGSGPLPLYFNLNQFGAKRYDANRARGILESCLREDYSIDINSDYFKDKSFIFLVDSLDESGDLSRIDDVLASVYKMKLNAPVDAPTPQFVVSSRPIDGFLKQQIQAHVRQADDEYVPQFIALYGFKQDQFDHWLKTSVKPHEQPLPLPDATDDIGVELLKGWQQDDQFSAWQKLANSRVLEPEELTKPLFCYILYQLIVNCITIPSKGRVGIYLAFLHYITSRAKFVNPAKPSVEEEYRNRKVLHAIAANWCFNRSTGKSSTLNRQSIQYCLTGTNKPTDEQQNELKAVDNLRFLSHSYFGDNENQLHFQHQSFAEVLLAEYYLKAFVQAAVEEKPDLAQLSNRLFVGEPNVEVMQFFEELINLLVRSAVTPTPNDNQVLTARRMLLPVLGTLAVPLLKSSFHSPVIEAAFYHQGQLTDTETIINQHWPITHETLARLLEIAELMFIDSEYDSYLARSTRATALYNDELVILDARAQGCERTNVNTWLAAAVGGLICREMQPRCYFFKSNIRGNKLFELIQRSNQRKLPLWLESISHGIFHRITVNDTAVDGLNLHNLDFTDGQFDVTSFYRCSINAQFTGCRLHNVSFRHCAITGGFEHASLLNVKMFACQLVTTQFQPLKRLDNLSIELTTFDYFAMPGILREKLRKTSHECIEESLERITVVGWQYLTLPEGKIVRKGNLETFSSLYHLLYAAMSLDKITEQDITDSFEFMSEKVRDDFIEDWPSVFKPLFSKIRHNVDYLALEAAFEQQIVENRQR